MSPFISVIIPVYNHAAALQRSLKTLHDQTYRHIEIILVNDGSKDDFEGAIKSIQDTSWGRELAVKVISQKNQGAAVARNRGYKESSGEYVIFWDADTIAEPTMLEKMVGALQKNKEASYAYCSFKFGWKKMTSKPFDANELRKNNYIDTTSLIRRSAIIPFDERLKRFQDWDLWLTMLEQNKIGVFIPEVLYSKLVAGRVGYSRWRPRFVFGLPWETKAVKNYREAQKIVLDKHHLGQIAKL